MKRILSLSLVLMMVLSLFAMAPITVSAATVTGGTEENPYLITQDNVAGLYGNVLTGYFKLEEDVTVTDRIYQITNAVFDGNNKTIFLDGISGPALFYNVGAANTEVIFKDLILDGTVNTTEAYAGSLIALANYGTITVDNVKNYADIFSTNQQAGGIIGRTNTNAVKTTVRNCENHGNVTITNNNYAGGIVGYVVSPTVVENCINYGDVILETAGKVYASGIVGATTGDLEITSCANYGEIKGDYVNGLVAELKSGVTVTVSKSFNAGKIYNTKNNTTKKGHAYGLVYSYNNAATVTDCFNVGPVYNTYNNEKVEGGFIIYKGQLTNVYNTFKGITTFAAGIGDTYVNTYTIDGTKLYGEEINLYNLKVVTDAELKELASTLGENFKTATPTKASAYPYPQIVGNEYVVAAASVPATLGTIGGGFSANEDISGTYADGEISYTGAYVAGFGIAQDLFGWEKSYGMILTDANGTEYEADAVANSATESGNYGVLFYGSKLVPGEYTLTPYVTYTNYGETHQVKGEAKTVTVAE